MNAEKTIEDIVVYSDSMAITWKDRIELIGITSLWLVLGFVILLISSILFTVPEFPPGNWVRIASWAMGLSVIGFSLIMIVRALLVKRMPLMITIDGILLQSVHVLARKPGRFIPFSEIAKVAQKPSQKPRVTYVTLITEITLRSGERIEVISPNPREFTREFEKAWRMARRAV